MRQLLRMVMAQHIFREVPGRPGVIVHTPASRILAQDDLLHQWLAWNTGKVPARGSNRPHHRKTSSITGNTPIIDFYLPQDEDWAASCHASAAMAKWPDAGEPDQTGFALAHGKTTYDYLSENPKSL